MKPPWLDIAKFLGVFAGSLLLNLPIYLFKYGTTGLIPFCLIISCIYIAVAMLEIFRHHAILPGLSSGPSLDRRLNIAFILTLPFFIANVADEFFPRYVYEGLFRGETFAASGGLLYGMLSGLLFDSSDTRSSSKANTLRKRWTPVGVWLGILFGVAAFLADGFSIRALRDGLSVMFAYELGLVFGLLLGRNVNSLVEALEPTFDLLHRMARTLLAYSVGFLIIVLLFASFFGAAWKLEGAQSFRGISEAPTLTTFIYFSLLTATTVGYGDIAPRSSLTRTLTGIESLVALGWTLVVFAALSVRFVDALRADSMRSTLSNHDKEKGAIKGKSIESD